MVGARLISNGLIFSSDSTVDIQLVTFSLLSSLSVLSIAEKN